MNKKNLINIELILQKLNKTRKELHETILKIIRFQRGKASKHSKARDIQKVLQEKHLRAKLVQKGTTFKHLKAELIQKRTAREYFKARLIQKDTALKHIHTN